VKNKTRECGGDVSAQEKTGRVLEARVWIQKLFHDWNIKLKEEGKVEETPSCSKQDMIANTSGITVDNNKKYVLKKV
jgi:hypothetical protein